MKRLAGFAATLISIAICVAGAALSRAYASEDEEKIESFADGLVTSAMIQHHIPGLTMAIVRDDDVVLLKGFGFADLENAIPVDPARHMFRIGSISKTLTFTALMQLVELGRVDVDADVNDYLTDFQIPEAFGAPVRVRDLLTHRAGFEEAYRDFWFAGGEGAAALPEFSDWMRDNVPARVFPPGQYAAYSNYGAALAGRIVEEVSGETYEDYLEAHIFEPLRMSHTTARQVLPQDRPRAMAPELGENLAAVYTSQGGAPRRHEFEILGPTAAGVVSSTAADMARYMRMHLSGGALEGAQVLEESTEFLMRRRPYEDRMSGPDYAHGFRTGFLGGYETFEHDGATATSYASMVMIPELGLGVFVNTNGGDNARAPRLVAYQILLRLVGDRAKQTPERIALSRDELSAYEGVYFTTRREFTGMWKLLNSYTRTSVAASPRATLLVNGPDGALELEPVGNDVFADIWTGERVTFLRGKDGDVVGHVSPYGHVTYLRLTSSTDINLLLFSFAAAFALTLTQLTSAWKRRAEPALASGGARQIVRLSLASAVYFLLLIVLGIFAVLNVPITGDRAWLWPGPVAYAFQTALVGLVVLTAILIAGLIPILSVPSVSVFRKIHYGSYVLALVALAICLNFWNLIGFKFW